MPEPACERLRQSQYAFAAYIRDPNHQPLPAVSRPERMRTYRELFFNNIQSFIGSGFPVLRQVLDDEPWLALLDDFFARHACATPYFSGVAEEFLDYLQNERGPRPQDPPFLLELAHYEWVELALSIAEGEAPTQDSDLEAYPLDTVIFLSELAWPLAYRYPVHQISRAFQPAAPPAEPTCLAVYRDWQDQVRFLELNAATYLLLQKLEQGPASAHQCLGQVAQALGHSDASGLLSHGAGILKELALRGVIGKAAA
jgi:hypothetical protein